MSHLSSGGDSYRPVADGAIRFEFEELAHELGIDPNDLPKVRYANPRTQSDGTEPARAIYKLISEAGEKSGGGTVSPPRGSMSAHEMRRLARGAGLDMGSARDDDADRLDTAKHEAAHACLAWCLGWRVSSVDIRSGETKCTPPDDLHGARLDEEMAVVAMAGAAFTNSHSDWEQFENDRWAIRRRESGWRDLEEVRTRVARALEDRPIRQLYERLTDALLIHGRLEGAALAAVLTGD